MLNNKDRDGIPLSLTYDIQANRSRYAYTLRLPSEEIEDDQSESARLARTVSSKLINGFIFTKETQSKEKLSFSERDIVSIARTLLFLQSFQVMPEEKSIGEIIFTGKITYSREAINSMRLQSPNITLCEFIRMLDSLLGAHFSKVAARAVTCVYSEYQCLWRYFPFGCELRLPSAADFVRLYRFVNIDSPSFSDAVSYILVQTPKNGTLYDNE